MENRQKSTNNLTRRKLLKHSINGALAACLSNSFWISGCGKKRHDSKITNIILISIDTLRADHLSCYGYHRPTSPAMDKFASQSLLFEDVLTPSPWTLPAHASLLTGLYPSRNGVRRTMHRLPNDVMTLAENLGQHGFLTAGIVNSHWLSEKNGLNREFADFTFVKESVSQVEPTEVEDRAFKWLSKYGNERFFLFLHYYDVHSDYCSLPRYEEQFVRPYHGMANGTTKQLLQFRRGQLSPNQSDIAHLIDLYDASIRQMDDGIDRLLKLLETKGLLDNTLVIVTSDHGEEFMEHGGVLHGRTYFQEIIRAPLIMHGPGLPQGKRIRQTASLVDVMPTILSLLGIAQPSYLDGIDLCPFWQKGDAALSTRFIFSEADWQNVIDNKRVDDIKCAVRQQRYKLLYDQLSGNVQLYDLFNDPKERIDVASEHTPIVDLLSWHLKEFMKNKRAGQPSQQFSPQEIEILKSLGYVR